MWEVGGAAGTVTLPEAAQQRNRHAGRSGARTVLPAPLASASAHLARRLERRLDGALGDLAEGHALHGLAGDRAAPLGVGCEWGRGGGRPRQGFGACQLFAELVPPDGGSRLVPRPVYFQAARRRRGVNLPPLAPPACAMRSPRPRGRGRSRARPRPPRAHRPRSRARGRRRAAGAPSPWRSPRRGARSRPWGAGRARGRRTPRPWRVGGGGGGD
jgi:hypothetical protein